MTPETATPSPAEQAPTSLSPSEATTKIEALLTAEEPIQDGQETEATAPEETVETAALETPEDTSKEVEPEGEEETAEQPDAESEENEDPLIAVQIDGREVPIPFSELQSGYLRNKDYTQKTQQIAEARRELEALRAEMLQERQVYANLIPRFEQKLSELNPQEPDWQALLQHGQQTGDISQYWVEKARWEEHSRTAKALQEEQGRLDHLRQLDMAEKLKGHLTAAQSFLAEKIPAWRDEKRATAEKARLKAYARDLGYSDQEIAHAYDPRMIVALHKAAAYDALMANKPKPTHDVRQVLRPGSTVGQQTSKVARVTKLKQRLAKTGRADDAVAAIEAILG